MLSLWRRSDATVSDGEASVNLKGGVVPSLCDRRHDRGLIGSSWSTLYKAPDGETSGVFISFYTSLDCLDSP